MDKLELSDWSDINLMYSGNIAILQEIMFNASPQVNSGVIASSKVWISNSRPVVPILQGNFR